MCANKIMSLGINEIHYFVILLTLKLRILAILQRDSNSVESLWRFPLVFDLSMFERKQGLWFSRVLKVQEIFTQLDHQFSCKGVPFCKHFYSSFSASNTDFKSEPIFCLFTSKTVVWWMFSIVFYSNTLVPGNQTRHRVRYPHGSLSSSWFWKWSLVLLAK